MDHGRAGVTWTDEDVMRKVKEIVVAKTAACQDRRHTDEGTCWVCVVAAVEAGMRAVLNDVAQ